MRLKLKLLLFISLCAWIPAVLLPMGIIAASCSVSGISVPGLPPQIPGNLSENLEIEIHGLDPNSNYNVYLRPNVNRGGAASTQKSVVINDGVGRVSFTAEQATRASSMQLILNRAGFANDCDLGTYTVAGSSSSCSISITSTSNGDLACGDANDRFRVNVSDVIVDGQPYTGDLHITTRLNTVTSTRQVRDLHRIANGYTVEIGPFSPGYQTDIQVPHPALLDTGTICSTSTSLRVIESAASCEEVMSQLSSERIFSLCKQANSGGGDGECDTCYRNGGVWTGLGCLKVNPSELVPQILQIAIGLGGGIALLLMLFGALQLTASAGNPESVQKGKETITSAITGLVVIIFSIVILQLIGVQILQIPGF